VVKEELGVNSGFSESGSCFSLNFFFNVLMGVGIIVLFFCNYIVMVNYESYFLVLVGY